jgi:hypothetical protein
LIRHLCELFASSQLEQYSTILQTCVPYIAYKDRGSTLMFHL